MGILIGIDYGMKRTGLAWSDTMKIIASPLETVDSKEVLNYLCDLAVKHPVDSFVLGYPTHIDGNESQMTRNVLQFKTELQKKFPAVEIHLEDELFTSKMAYDSMKREDISRKKRKEKGNLDKISAAIILQSFMDKII